MALAQQFLDEVRARTVLSALIGRAVKLVKSGREFQACCPFHSEKSPSFTVNDEKGFYHCFGCGAHGDAFRWLTDHDSTPFIDAVKQLALAAGLEMPAPSPDEAIRAARAQTVRGALEAAQGAYAAQLGESGAVMEYLTGTGPNGRGLSAEAIAAFGIGYARGGDGSLKGRGIGEAAASAAGLLVASTDNSGLREMFWDRITVPIHDHRGELAGFGARIWPGRVTQKPKFINSPDGPLFDKGRMLFNLHRAAPLARNQAENRLIIVEGYFDVIALAQVGIGAVVAPMGTALTPAQLERAWRVHQRPVLLFDGDAAGRRAAVRACETALALLGPGRELAVALLPDGADPDDLLRTAGADEGRRAIEAIICEARGLHGFLFGHLVSAALDAAGGECGPEQTAAIWAELSALAGRIGDDETRAQYLGMWRARFDRELSAVPQLAEAEQLYSVVPAAPDPETGKFPAYAFPASTSDSEARLIAIIRAALQKRAARREITEEIGDLMKMAEAVGFVKSEITAALRDIESDLAHGPARREESEMVRVLYRRTLGIRGPMNEAMLPQLVEGRARAPSIQGKRRAAQNALIDARGLQI